MNVPNRLNRDSAPASELRLEPQAANDSKEPDGHHRVSLLRIWSSTSANGSPENPSQNMQFCMQLEAVNLRPLNFKIEFRVKFSWARFCKACKPEPGPAAQAGPSDGRRDGRSRSKCKTVLETAASRRLGPGPGPLWRQAEPRRTPNVPVAWPGTRTPRRSSGPGCRFRVTVNLKPAGVKPPPPAAAGSYRCAKLPLLPEPRPGARAARRRAERPLCQ